MNWLELLQNVTQIAEENIGKTARTSIEFHTKEVNVYFDFPLHGNARNYKISKVTKRGIMLVNDEIVRPKGH